MIYIEWRKTLRSCTQTEDIFKSSLTCCLAPKDACSCTKSKKENCFFLRFFQLH